MPYRAGPNAAAGRGPARHRNQPPRASLFYLAGWNGDSAGFGDAVLNGMSWAAQAGCLLAATTAFIQAGQPASPAPWNACTRALAQELVPFPGP
jgi:hypothetical protein